jgi:ATP-dependent DNA helicase RecG
MSRSMNTSKTDTDVSKTAAITAKRNRQDLSRRRRHGAPETRKSVQSGPGDARRLSGDLSARLGLAPDRRSVRVPVGYFEEKIMTWVKAHGRITRGEAVALCGLGSDQAKRILSSMVKKGLLSPRRRGRGAYYGPAQKETGGSPIQSDSPDVSASARSCETPTRGQSGRPGRVLPELCKVGPFQASRLLRPMASKGKLCQRGTGKGTYYERRT